MNELVTNDLTEEQLKDLEITENKRKYKILQKYLQTKEYKELVEKFIQKWKDIEDSIEKYIRDRKETKATKSELDKSLQFYDFQQELKNSLWDSEAEQILKADIQEMSENTYTHILNKIEELYDAPTYSELDLIRQLRIDYILVESRIWRIIAWYLDAKQEISNPNPYEE